MEIKKIASALFRPLCLGLFGTSIWFLSNPIEVSADGTCTASCAHGPAFQIIAKQDSSLARNLASDLPRDYRIAALFAVEIANALTDLSAKPASAVKIIVKN